MVVLDIHAVNENDNDSHIICTLGIVDGVVKVVRGNERLGQELINRPIPFMKADVHSDPDAWMEEVSEYYQGTYVWAGYPYNIPDSEVSREAL
jgi:hypothetical protein